jgi:hypothetical protein
LAAAEDEPDIAELEAPAAKKRKGKGDDEE